MAGRSLLKARIEKIAAGGAGIARIEGKTVFIDGCIPGETVFCRIIAEHRSWSRAELIEVTEASGERVQPHCGFYGKCGGCNMQHLNYTAQLTAKTVVLKDTFARVGGFKPPEPLVFPSKPWEYRNRMQFHCKMRQSETIWGLKARKNTDIISISDCPIADPGIRQWLQSEKQQSQVCVSPEKDRCAVYSRNGLFLCENGIKRGKTQLLGRNFIVDAGVFFQSNGAMLEQMAADLREIAGSADRSLAMADLYCGVGTFTAFLADLFPHVDLVEENKTALNLARENIAPYATAEFFARRSEDWAKTGITSCPSYGLIVVDPPRQGLAPALASRLAHKGPPLLVYISCDPATLARDSAILIKDAYTLTELRCYDFYPQTAHIESMAVFAR